jgi:hypothetical protein
VVVVAAAVVVVAVAAGAVRSAGNSLGSNLNWGRSDAAPVVCETGRGRSRVYARGPIAYNRAPRQGVPGEPGSTSERF